MLSISLRRFSLIFFIFCCILIAGAYYLQFGQGFQPCWLCSIQRLALMGLAGSFLLCALQRPKKIGVWVYTALDLLIAMIGLVASGRQIWLQNQPMSPENICKPTLPIVLNNPVLLEALNNLGTHDCADAGPYFLGVGLSLWTFLAFTSLIMVVLMMPLLFAGSKNK